jgi:MFS family permease
LSAALDRTFLSLRVPNYRRYFAGQVVSISGNWMQTVAEMWLVVQLTGSGAAVGLTAALQFLPVLLFGAMGGVLADRMDKRRLLMVTQALMAIPALTLWALTIGGSVQLWMVYALVMVRGSINAIDNPARQSFVTELVGADRTVNAVALNSVIVHSARIVGPALAGGVIALVGVGPCFLVNSLSFGAMLVALFRMDPSLRIPLAMMALVGTLSFNFQVLLPLLASFTWHGTATTYALLTTAMGIGSVSGALAAGARGRVDAALLVGSATAFGVLLGLAAGAPSLWLQVAVLVPLGAVSVTFAAGVNSTLQLAVDPLMRGRVMALYSVVFLGSTPIGAPLVGWLAGAVSPRAGLALGAVAALVAAAGARWAFRQSGTPVAPVVDRHTLRVRARRRAAALATRR